MSLPEFFRVQWVSEAARVKWEPILSRISQEAHRVETETVKLGMRKVGLISGGPGYIRQASRGLDSQVLGIMRQPKVYSNAVQPYEDGKAFDLRTVIGPTKWVSYFSEAFNDNDDYVMGRLLGYPECCIKFFANYWVGKKIRDFSWIAANIKTNQISCLLFPWTEINPMWTRLNIRAFQHIPCSYRCLPSWNLTWRYKRLWDKDVWSQYMKVLSWPVEWSALHGAAEIRTPILKMVYDTDYTDMKKTIQLFGSVYPIEGRWKLNHNIAYNNGFQSLDSMQRYHAPIIGSMGSLNDLTSIFDPGCGNGHLLKTLAAQYPKAKAIGCDVNEHAILEGKLLEDNVNIVEEDMFDQPHPSADLIVLMPGRLAEVPEDKARAYVNRMVYKYLLLYVYGDSDILWEIRDKYFSGLRTMRIEVNEQTTALLLERQ